MHLPFILGSKFSSGIHENATMNLCAVSFSELMNRSVFYSCAMPQMTMIRSSQKQITFVLPLGNKRR
jgi:hypothetical protein